MSAGNTFKRVANQPGLARQRGQARHLAVGRHPPPGNARDHGIDPLVAAGGLGS